MSGSDDLTRFEHLVPAASQADPGKRLDRIESLLARVLNALGADQLQPDAPAGIIQRQNAQESHLVDHEERITALEQGGVKTADRWMGLVFDLIKTIGGGIVGAWLIKGGSH